GCRPRLAALSDKADIGIGALVIDEGAEALELLRILQGIGPFAFVAIDDLLHLFFQLRTQSQAVLEDHLLQIIQAAVQALAPGGGALQPVGCADVEHEKTVDGADQRLFIQIRGEEFGMARTHAAVTGDVEVPAALGGDDADVLALGLGTRTGAAGDAELDLVRCAQALVAVLQFQRHADAVLHAVAAPGTADAGLHRTQGLAVGVPGLETGRNQLGPDIRQLVQLGAEQVDTLATGDLGVEVVLAGHLAQHYELVRGEIAAGNSGSCRVGAFFLHVKLEGVVVIVRWLLRRISYDIDSTEWDDEADYWLADIAPDAALAMAGLHARAALHTLHADNAVH